MMQLLPAVLQAEPWLYSQRLPRRTGPVPSSHSCLTAPAGSTPVNMQMVHLLTHKQCTCQHTNSTPVNTQAVHLSIHKQYTCQYTNNTPICRSFAILHTRVKANVVYLFIQTQGDWWSCTSHTKTALIALIKHHDCRYIAVTFTKGPQLESLAWKSLKQTCHGIPPKTSSSA